MAVAASVAAASPAAPQTLHGVGEVQYQRLEQAATGFERETWIKSFQTDYARRLPGTIEFAARFRFTEQTVVGQPDRLRVPEGSLRFAHQNFGLSAAYRPTSTRDARRITTRQQNLTLTGYAQKAGLPSLSGSWVRTHVDSTTLSRETATVTRSLSSIYTVRNLALHAGYGDRLLEFETGIGSRPVERHVNLGAVSQFQVLRAPVSVLYDFTQASANPTGNRSQRSRAHTASANSGFQLSRKTSAGLNYTYRRSGVLDTPGTLVQEHNGALSLSHAITPAFLFSSGAGVRSARFGGRSLTERFVNAGLSAQGEARPGWRVGAGTGRTYAWLPGAPVRTSDNLSANTAMRLANGLDVRGDAALASTRHPETAGDSIGPAREVGLQLGAGLTVLPLRTLYLDASARRNRSGASTLRGSPTTTAYSVSVRITPSRRLQMGGGWSTTRAAASRGSTLQATVVWNPGAGLQASGGYDRARQRTLAPFLPSESRQETFSGSLAMALGRSTSAAVRYSDANRGQPSHVRQLTVNLTRRFGR